MFTCSQCLLLFLFLPKVSLIGMSDSLWKRFSTLFWLSPRSILFPGQMHRGRITLLSAKRQRWTMNQKDSDTSPTETIFIFLYAAADNSRSVWTLCAVSVPVGRHWNSTCPFYDGLSRERCCLSCRQKNPVCYFARLLAVHCSSPLKRLQGRCVCVCGLLGCMLRVRGGGGHLKHILNHISCFCLFSQFLSLKYAKSTLLLLWFNVWGCFFPLLC